jgi:PPP family 3-phenylpropionic acid transporter
MSNVPYWRLAGVYFFYFAYIGAFGPYFSLYLSSLGIAAGGIGIIMSLPQAVRIPAPQLWGWLADKSGRALGVARGATVVGTVAYCAIFGAKSFAALFTVVLVMSFFLSAPLPLLEATTLAHLGEHTALYGRIRVWGSIGYIVTVVLVGYVFEAAPLTILLWILLGLLIGAIVLLMVVPAAPQGEHVRDYEPISKIMRKPEVIALMVACALMAVAHGPYYSFYSIDLVAHGYRTGQVGALWALGVICEIAIFYWMPQLFRAFTQREVLLASFALAAVRFLIIAWGAGSALLLVLAQVLHAASFGSFHASALGLVNNYFSGRNQSRGQAIYMSLTFGLGGTLGGIYAGYAWEILGAGPTFTGAALSAAAGFLILRLAPRPHGLMR